MRGTKKHFAAIAAIISDASRYNSAEQACDHIAEGVANYFAKHNPNFNKQRFLDACEPKREPNWTTP